MRGDRGIVRAMEVTPHSRLARLSLGTVQLGLNYGIANRTGKPEREASLAILAESMVLGVRAFDTAPVYGDAEDLLGEACCRNAALGPFEVTTKLRKIEPTDLVERVRESVRSSAALFPPGSIEACHVHDVPMLRAHGEALASGLATCVAEGLIRAAGASIYSPSDLEWVLAHGGFDVVQIPLNALDERWQRDGLLDRARARGIRLHARSVFLQGLLFLPVAEVPPGLGALGGEVLGAFRALAAEVGLTPTQLSLACVRDNPAIDRVVIGCESLEQLRGIVAMWDVRPLTENERARVAEIAATAPEVLLDPSRWPKETAS